MKIQKLMMVALVAATFTACKDDEDPIIVVPPSDGSANVEFSGLAGTESGANAGNVVYLDMSKDKNTAVLRSSWDLGFYSGTDFRVILNNQTSAGAKVTTKTNLADVTAADTIGQTLTFNHMGPTTGDLAFYDDIDGDLTKTVVPAVSATDANNPVIILNRGEGGATAARPWVKFRVLRNGANGYTVQYAGITETTFKTFTVTKNSDYNFVFGSFTTGAQVSVEPAKADWDIVWGYSLFKTNFGGGTVPYNYSDMIAVNYLAGVTVQQKVYADAATAAAAYTAFNKDSVNASSLVAGRWIIADKWRSTQPATGARQDRFYVIKDANNNHYVLKCVSMGVGTDGGTRGKPVFSYKLIK